MHCMAFIDGNGKVWITLGWLGQTNIIENKASTRKCTLSGPEMTYLRHAQRYHRARRRYIQ